MKKEYLEELIEITEQLKNLEDLYVVEVDTARKALGKNELDEDELDYKSCEIMGYFVEKLSELTEKIVKEQK